jgi:hypothetical protein
MLAHMHALEQESCMSTSKKTILQFGKGFSFLGHFVSWVVLSWYGDVGGGAPPPPPPPIRDSAIFRSVVAAVAYYFRPRFPLAHGVLAALRFVASCVQAT